MSFLFALVGVTWIVYHPGLSGPFVFDDISNLVDNERLRIDRLTFETLSTAAFSSDSGVLKRPLAMLSFALNYYAAGGFGEPALFKTVNVLIHALNAFLVFVLVTLLTRTPGWSSTDNNGGQLLPVVAAAMWALHPIHLTAVLYAVQRMTLMSTTFVLLGLLLFLHGRLKLHAQKPKSFWFMSFGIVIGGGLGVLSKENAALLPYYCLVIELTLFRAWMVGDPVRYGKLYLFYAAVAAIPLAATIAILAAQPGLILDTYAIRDFSLNERLLTESRVLWFYLGLLFSPRLSEFSVFHDDFPISTGLLMPITTALSVAGLVSLCAAAFLFRHRFPVFAFALAWFLVGHAMESTILALEIVHEHRNYLPTLGPILAFVAAVLSLRRRSTTAAKAIPVALFAIVFGLAGMTALRANTWRSDESIIFHMIQHHPRSARAQVMAAEVSLERRQDFAAAFAHYRRAQELAPRETDIAIRQVMLAASIRKIDGSYPYQKILQDLDPIISTSLAVDQPRPNTLQAMTRLGECLAVPHEYCRALYPLALNWFSALLANPNLNANHRQGMTIYAFGAAIAGGDYSSALAVAEQAQRLQPTALVYELMRIEALIKLGRIYSAKSALDALARHSGPWSIEDRENFDILKEMLAKRAEKER